uniref:WSC domain-containing protein n=1 Tax=Macrostomum lignano TaxID=282301 RepID=A0A1I8GWY6_9PLAT
FNKNLRGSADLTRFDLSMFRTVLLLFCMSAAIYGALSCPSSKKKSEPDATPETKEDPPKDRSDWPSENQFHPGGCYRIHGIGPRAELKKMSPRICALECAGKSPKKSQSFGLAYGDTCLCESELESRMLPTELDPEVHCSHRCPGNHRQSCGGDMAVAYFNLSAVLSSTKKGK